jgi:hypothetical protein
MEEETMKPQEQIAQLEREKAALEEQVSGLKKRVAELETARPKSKSRQQADAGLEMLKKGPVALAQFASLNPKYPADIPYNVRNLLKIDVKTVRTAGGTLYMLPEHFAIHQAGLEKDKAAAKEAKEEIQAAPIPQSPQTGAAAATLAV